jgi:glucose uptake protein GlcU
MARTPNVPTVLRIAAASEAVAAGVFAVLALAIDDLRLILGLTALVLAVSAVALSAAARRAGARLALEEGGHEDDPEEPNRP